MSLSSMTATSNYLFPLNIIVPSSILMSPIISYELPSRVHFEPSESLIVGYFTLSSSSLQSVVYKTSLSSTIIVRDGLTFGTISF